MPGEYRQPVPDDEWKKFSDQHEAEVEVERAQIRTEQPAELTHKEAGQPVYNGYPLEHPQEGLSPISKLAVRVEAGEITKEQANQELLDMYHQTPTAARNYRRDVAFTLLPEQEQRQEILQEAIRDTYALSETLRVAISDPKKQRRLRDLLQEINNEIQKEPI